MTRTTKTKTKKAKRAHGLDDQQQAVSPVADDPAIVAAKEAEVAKAAWLALPEDETPKYKAAEKRYKKAEEAFSAASVMTIAGALTKLRALGKDIAEDSGTDSWELGHVKTVTAFLEGLAGAPATAPKPDPVVVLFAKWGALQDEAVAMGKAHPDFNDPDVERRRQKLCDRQLAAEDQIIETAATSVGGIAVKLRLLAYMKFPMKGLSDLYATPAKDTDFKGLVERWREEGGEGGFYLDDSLLVDTLLDAERLAGVS